MVRDDNSVLKDSQRNAVPLGLTAVLGMLAMLGPFSIDTMYPALFKMQQDLGVSEAAIQQSVSIYLLGYAAMSPFHGPVSDMLGRRRVILCGLLTYIAASMGCALSLTLTQLLLFRFAQGISAGAGLIVGRAVIRDLVQGTDAQKLMSQVSLVFAIGPAIAPIIGGWIAPRMHWHSIYWFLSALGIMVFVITWVLLPESHPVRSRLPLRVRVLSKVYRDILTNRKFVVLSLAATANFGAVVLYITSAPSLILRMLHLTTSDFIYFFGPNIAGMILGSFVNGRIAGRLKPMSIANLGFGICGIATLLNVAYSLLSPSYSLPWAILPLSMLSFGVALTFPILTLAILDMFPCERGSASSMQSFFSQLGNAAVAGLLSPFANRSPGLLACCAAVLSLTSVCLWTYLTQNSRRVRLPATAESV